jgi:hypothetical protein
MGIIPGSRVPYGPLLVRVDMPGRHTIATQRVDLSAEFLQK